MSKKQLCITTRQKATENKESVMRKVCYYDNDVEKPILAAGVFFVKGEGNQREILMQKVEENDRSFIYSDFGGKIDLSDNTVVQTAARELGEELNFGMYQKKRGTNVYLDQEGLKKVIQQNILTHFYMPVAKYFLLFCKFDDDMGLDMEKIGDHEKLDKINRTVEWITEQDFVKSHFEHTLHPRLWGKQILEYMGHQSSVPRRPRGFAFKKT